MTLAKVVNLPKRFKDQDDELVDQDTFVLLGQRTRVFDREGKRLERVARSEVDTVFGDAERVRVHGKMLRPDKWRKDEDDSPVPTIRAKVYVLG